MRRKFFRAFFKKAPVVLDAAFAFVLATFLCLTFIS